MVATFVFGRIYVLSGQETRDNRSQASAVNGPVSVSSASQRARCRKAGGGRCVKDRSGGSMGIVESLQ